MLRRVVWAWHGRYLRRLLLSVVRLNDAVAWVAHTQEVLGASKALLAAVTDAESDERGYVIAPAQRHYLDSLAPLIIERLRNISYINDLRTDMGFDAARAEITIAVIGGGAIFAVAVVAGTLEEHFSVELCCLCSYSAAEHELTVLSVSAKRDLHTDDLGLTEHAVVSVNDTGLSRCIGGELVYEPDLGRTNVPLLQALAEAGHYSLVAVPLEEAGVRRRSRSRRWIFWSWTMIRWLCRTSTDTRYRRP